MKKFNLKLLVPLILTLVLQGCMPDSLTKFKKDPPKKAAPIVVTPETTPVVDGSGNVVSFTGPTKAFYKTEVDPLVNLTAFVPMTALPLFIDNTLSADIKLTTPQFFENCALDISGDAQTTDLNGLSLDPVTCEIGGTPSGIKTVQSAFCSDPTKLTQPTCEASYQTWNSLTSTCSNPDYQYITQAACIATKNKWYAAGTAIPYRIKVSYHDNLGVAKSISTTIRIASLAKIENLTYNQSDKVLLQVTPASGLLTNIVPVETTAASTADYARENTIVSSFDTYGIAKYVDTTLSKIGVSKLILLFVSDVTPYTKGQFITVLGTCSKATRTTQAECISAVAGVWNAGTSTCNISSRLTQVDCIDAVPGVWTSSNKIGRIFELDTNYNALYVENFSPDNLYFAANDRLCNTTTGVSSVDPINHLTDAILDVDESEIFSSSSPSIDNDLQYYSNKFNITTATSIFETVSTIKPLAPIAVAELVTENAVTYTITPALPTTLSFNSSTGTITGYFATELEATTFTITATNALGSRSTTISLGAIKAPTDLSLTTKQIITVSNTSGFIEGEEIFQPITPPLTESIKGKILNILNGYQLAIETYNGNFLENASLDSGNGYYGEKAFVIPDSSCTDTNYTDQTTCEANGYAWSTGPVYFNLMVKLNSLGVCSNGAGLDRASCAALSATWSGDYVQDDPITVTAGTGLGAAATVAGVKPKINPATDDVLFVKFLTQTATGTATTKQFYQGDTADNGATITEIMNENVKLELASVAGISVGSDLTNSANVSGYIHAINTTTKVVSVSDLSRSGTQYFKNLDSVDAEEVYAAPLTTIAKVTHDNLYVVERGANFTINAFLTTGNSVVFSISPALPAGLILDTKTGKISGKPTVASPRKDFILSATNFIGSTKFVFSLEVRDYFKLTDLTGGPSMILHKVGETQSTRKCRINSTDILNTSPNYDALDIRCFLDAEEEDIHFNQLQIQASTGANICEYVQYAPYYFQRWSPMQSISVSHKYPTVQTINTGCLTTGSIPAATACAGNWDDDSGPNCDEGYLEYDEVAWTPDGLGVCNVQAAPVRKQVSCGGSKVACMIGPVTEILTETSLIKGNRSVILNSATGLTKAWTHKSPVEALDYTNLRAANGTVNNRCTTSNTDASTWASSNLNALTPESSLSIASPFGALTPYSAAKPGASPFYTFNCLNAAKEIKARIRLVVRDWDTAFKLDDQIDNQLPGAGANALMNNGGTDSFGALFNNYADWDDIYIVSKPVASYGGATCGLQAASSCTLPGYVAPVDFDADATLCDFWGGDHNGATCDMDATTCGRYGVGITGGGICDYKTQFECDLHGGTWTGDNNYQFPKGEL